jgi:acid stress-induced BolA-like protein IbaG/YrbA
MALQVLNSGPDPALIVEKLRDAIATSLPEAQIEVQSRGPGHFEISVVSEEFEGKSRVQQHQRVYAAISDLMSGPQAPVHAIDRLECRVR